MKTAIEQAATRMRSNAVAQESARETEASTIIALQAEVMALQDKVVELIPYKARCEAMDAMPEPEIHACTECAVSAAKLALREAECAALKTEVEKHKQMCAAEMQKRHETERVNMSLAARMDANEEAMKSQERLFTMMIASQKDAFADLSRALTAPAEEVSQQEPPEWVFNVQRDGANQMLRIVAKPEKR